MRLPASVHARLRKIAHADHRSMADVALIAIEKYIAEVDGRSRR
jgi:predicted DNA-binding protein